MTPLASFAAELGADSPLAAMRLACARLRERVRADGGTPGLRVYLQVYGLRVEEAPIPTAGRLDYEDGRYVVRVQRTRHREEPPGARPAGRRPPAPPTVLPLARATNRQRFTIAHEIGHAILFERLAGQPEVLAALREPAHWADTEALCDVAAHELLVPLDELLPAVRSAGVSLRGVERLAARFRVAREVACARLLAAGALSLSVWRVQPARAGHDDRRTTVAFERVLAHVPGDDAIGHGAALVLDRASTAARQILLEAAQHGHAQTPSLSVRSALGEATVAGIAACHAPLMTRAEQPHLLEAPAQVAVPSVGRASAAASAQVTLLLLPNADTPLWWALSRG
ncbi:MAG: ImmA/IrrE family metallo-endopeptidase [Chloroflexi bacterium]|nr:ImmA/IrrE family metallo-endopeptidase [Chloroflexota bacterium]